MSEYAPFVVADYPVLSMRNLPIPEIMTIFREGDKCIFERRVNDRSPEVWGEGPWGEDDEEETAVQYATTVATAKARLQIMGFSMSTLRRGFASVQAEAIRFFRDDDVPTMLSEGWEASARLHEQADAEAWVRALQQLRTSGVTQRPRDRSVLVPTTLVELYLTEQEPWDVLPFDDPRWWLVLWLESCPEDAEVFVDFSDFAAGGWYEDGDKLVERALEELTYAYPRNERVVILAEGKSDVTALQGSLELLFPELACYYAFFDFDASRAPGSAPALVNVVKAFASTGISNRIVALFDNDAAARDALRNLRHVTLPDNIRVLTYPALDLLRAYPTIGPTGSTLMDVNGLAGSIELYFGRDVLEADGQLTPIQWTGYVKGVDSYQGEVLDKGRLQTAFTAKLRRCQADPERLAIGDWQAMRQLLQTIFAAFA